MSPPTCSEVSNSLTSLAKQQSVRRAISGNNGFVGRKSKNHDVSGLLLTERNIWQEKKRRYYKVSVRLHMGGASFVMSLSPKSLAIFATDVDVHYPTRVAPFQYETRRGGPRPGKN
jgi:hypothetical protein